LYGPIVISAILDLWLYILAMNNLLARHHANWRRTSKAGVEEDNKHHHNQFN
jgi:hypothetical protein